MLNIKIKKLFSVIPSISLLILTIIALSSCDSENIPKDNMTINPGNGIYTLTGSWFYNHNFKSSNNELRYAETWIDIGNRKLKSIKEFNDNKGAFLLKRDLIIKDNKHEYGILVPFHNLNRKWLLSLLWYCFICSICFFLGFYNLFFFLKRKQEKYYLSFSIFSLSFGLWVLGYKGITLWISSSQLFHIAATYPFMICAVISCVTFIHGFLSIRYNIRS